MPRREVNSVVPDLIVDAGFEKDQRPLIILATSDEFLVAYASAQEFRDITDRVATQAGPAWAVNTPLLRAHPLTHNHLDHHSPQHLLPHAYFSPSASINGLS